MAQIPRTTNDVIVNSLYLLGELGVTEKADAFMLSTGLELINELLDKFSSDSIYIPYLTDISFTLIPGKSTYSFSDILVGTDIVSDRIVDLSFATYTVPGTGFSPIVNPPISFVYTADTVSNTLTIEDTSPFQTGTPVTLQATGVVPSPLVAGVTYYTIVINSTQLKLAATLQESMTGPPIQLLTNGTPVNIITFFQGDLNVTDTSLVYPLRIINKATYYGVNRQNNLVARPGVCFLDKQPLESFVTFYPAPDQPYPCNLYTKVMLNSVVAQQNLSGLPPYYYGFLKYALARKFKEYYPSGNWSETAEQEYQDYYYNLKTSNETDLTIRPSATLTAPEPFWWQNILAY